MSWQATHWAQAQRTGSATAKVVLMLLAENVGSDSITFLSVASLMERCELGRGAVLKHLAILEGLKLIDRKRRENAFGHRSTDAITLAIDAETLGSPDGPRADPKVHVVDLGDVPKSTSDTAKVHVVHGQGSRGEPDIVSYKSSTGEKEPSARAKPSTQIPEGFPDEGAIDREKLFLQQKGRDIDAVLEAEKFAAYALANGKRYIDWKAAFHGWIARAIGYAGDKAKIPVVSAVVGPVAAPWRQRVKAFTDPANRFWNATDWGPAPGREGCKAPVEIVAEFIADPSGKVVPIGRAVNG